MATFPLLDGPELRISLTEIGCTLPADFDIDRPNAKSCVAVYSWFWEHFTGVQWASVKEGADAYMQSVLDQGNGEHEMYNEALQIGMQYETL